MNAELAIDFGMQAHGDSGGLASSSRVGAGERAIFNEVVAALEEGSLDLPVLPDMALKVQDLIDDPDTSVNKIIDLLASDPVVSMYVIRAANSAALANGGSVSDLRSAISRLGYRMLRSLVINVTMSRLFRARNPLINQQLIKLWRHSREVAARCFVLAQRHRHLRPDEAMLAGLVHEIGALPLYLYADRSDSRLDQPALEHLASEYSAAVGTLLLQSWNFPAELVAVAAEHENLCRVSGSDLPDYVDVVTVANLQMADTAETAPWKNMLAAERLGYYPADCRHFLPYHAEQLADAKDMLGIDAARH